MNAQKQPRRCSIKTFVLENFAKFTGKHLCQSLCFNKVARPADCATVAFLCILRNFLKHLFYRTALDDCFWMRWSALLIITRQEMFFFLQLFNKYQEKKRCTWLCNSTLFPPAQNLKTVYHKYHVKYYVDHIYYNVWKIWANAQDLVATKSEKNEESQEVRLEKLTDFCVTQFVLKNDTRSQDYCHNSRSRIFRYEICEGIWAKWSGTF